MNSNFLYTDRLPYVKEELLSKLSRVIVVSFLMTTILFFLFRNQETSYYNLDNISISEFIGQFVIFLIFFAGLSVFHRSLRKQFLSLLICFLLLLFLIVFIIKAPSFSLYIGAMFVAIPPMYYSLTLLFKDKNFQSKLNRVLSLVNVMFFLTIIVLILTNINMSTSIFEGVNTSNISNNSILFGERVYYFLGSMVVAIILLGGYFLVNIRSNHIGQMKNIKVAFFSVIGFLLLYQITILSIALVARVQSFYVTTFDFGIFTQMFYNMRNMNGMVTTLERGVELSHLFVHVSPIYYLILPLFAVFPYPETLQVAQVLIVSIGVIPLYLLAKTFKLSIFITGILLVMYMFHPAILSSSFYDLHENCFLAPLLLFLLYFVIKQKTFGFFISLILTLLIKEDASIYVFFIGMFIVFGYSSRVSDITMKKKNTVYGSIMVVSSVIYFIVVTQLLNSYSEGAMFWRYDNLNAYPNLHILGIVFTLFQNPSYLLATMFSPDKIYSMLILLFILGLIPLLSRNIADYWLIVPLIVINFATTYPYQHQFGYQYYFGTTVLLIFMVMINMKDKISQTDYQKRVGKYSTIYYVGSIVFVFIGIIILTVSSFKYVYNSSNRISDLERKEFLLEIPSDKSILATNYLTTYLANREQLYDFHHYDLDQSTIVFDYIILDRNINQDTINVFIVEALTHNYQFSDLSNEYFIILIPVYQGNMAVE